MASVQDIIKILKGKTALYSMVDGSESAIPQDKFMEVALELKQLYDSQLAKSQKEIGEDMISRSIAGFRTLPKGEQGFWKGYWQAYNDRGASLANKEQNDGGG